MENPHAGCMGNMHDKWDQTSVVVIMLQSFTLTPLPPPCPVTQSPHFKNLSTALVTPLLMSLQTLSLPHSPPHSFPHPLQCFSPPTLFTHPKTVGICKLMCRCLPLTLSPLPCHSLTHPPHSLTHPRTMGTCKLMCLPAHVPIRLAERPAPSQAGPTPAISCMGGHVNAYLTHVIMCMWLWLLRPVLLSALTTSV